MFKNMEFAEIDIVAFEGLDIAYQGAADAKTELEDAIHDGATEVEIEVIDSPFYMHFANNMIFNDNYSHSFLNHYHNMRHGMMLNLKEATMKLTKMTIMEMDKMKVVIVRGDILLRTMMKWISTIRSDILEFSFDFVI